MVDLEGLEEGADGRMCVFVKWPARHSARAYIKDLECGWVLFAFILFWPLESIVLVQ